MFKSDPKYVEYRQFGLFELKVATDYDSKKEYLVLESDIIETTMHVDSRPVEPQPSIKKFYKKLELYFDDKNSPTIVMDLTPLHLENSIGISAKIVTDGYVADTLEIKLSRADLLKFRKLKPTGARVVLYDGEGKIVTAADASVTNEK